MGIYHGEKDCAYSETFECADCGRECCYCFGGHDEHDDLCDDCWCDAKGIPAGDMYLEPRAFSEPDRGQVARDVQSLGLCGDMSIRRLEVNGAD